MIYKKKAIKNWWLLKNGYNYMRYIKDLGVKKETEKAILIFYKTELGEWTAWVPKSVLCDEWENDPGTEEPVYKEFITNDYYKRLNGTISPYKAKSTERAVRNETGIHVDYISMMAVFYKILFNGHYMDASC